jgi:hypothetical protein
MIQDGKERKAEGIDQSKLHAPCSMLHAFVSSS